jgi:hypothetical protein
LQRVDIASRIYVSEIHAPEFACRDSCVEIRASTIRAFRDAQRFAISLPNRGIARAFILQICSTLLDNFRPEI